MTTKLCTYDLVSQHEIAERVRLLKICVGEVVILGLAQVLAACSLDQVNDQHGVHPECHKLLHMTHRLTVDDLEMS